MKNILILIIFCYAESNFAQSSILQDKAGESSLKIFNDQITINTSNESISFQFFDRNLQYRKVIKELLPGVTDSTLSKKHILYDLNNNKFTDKEETYLKKVTKVYNQFNDGEIGTEDDDFLSLPKAAKDIIIGQIEKATIENEDYIKKDGTRSLSLSLKANKGVSNIFSGNDFVPQIDVEYVQGYNKGLFAKGYKRQSESIKYFYWSVLISRSEFNLFHDSTSKLEKEEFYSIKGSFGQNWITESNCFMKNGKASVVLLGLGFNFGRFNNFNDLKGVETFTSTDIGDGNFLVESITAGFKGDYTDFFGANILADAYIYPAGLKNRIGFGAFARMNNIGNTQRINLGIGAVVTKDKKPTNVVLSVMLQSSDVFNNLNAEDSSFSDRLGLNIIAGYNF